MGVMCLLAVYSVQIHPARASGNTTRLLKARFPIQIDISKEVYSNTLSHTMIKFALRSAENKVTIELPDPRQRYQDGSFTFWAHRGLIFHWDFYSFYLILRD